MDWNTRADLVDCTRYDNDVWSKLVLLECSLIPFCILNMKVYLNMFQEA